MVYHDSWMKKVKEERKHDVDWGGISNNIIITCNKITFLAHKHAYKIWIWSHNMHICMCFFFSPPILAHCLLSLTNSPFIFLFFSVVSFLFFSPLLSHHPHLTIQPTLLSPTQMEDARVGLQASLLVRSPESGELFVNFDPEILTQIREVNCMTKMNLEIPLFAALLQQKQDTLKKNYNKLQVDITHSCTHLQIHKT